MRHGLDDFSISYSTRNGWRTVVVREALAGTAGRCSSRIAWLCGGRVDLLDGVTRIAPALVLSAYFPGKPSATCLMDIKAGEISRLIDGYLF